MPGISRTLEVVAIPCVAAGAILLVAVAVRHRRAVAASLSALALAALAALGSPPVADALVSALEAPARNTARQAVYDAVIVLGDGEPRVAAGAALVASRRARHLLYSGFLPPRAIAGLRADVRSRGVADGQLVLETRSRNTHENAVESARVVAASGWRSLLLVTSAAHMERAAACFRKVGLEPDLYPVAYEGGGANRGWRPGRAAWLRSARALHELVGLVVYRILGYAA